MTPTAPAGPGSTLHEHLHVPRIGATRLRHHLDAGEQVAPLAPACAPDPDGRAPPPPRSASRPRSAPGSLPGAPEAAPRGCTLPTRVSGPSFTSNSATAVRPPRPAPGGGSAPAPRGSRARGRPPSAPPRPPGTPPPRRRCAGPARPAGTASSARIPPVDLQRIIPERQLQLRRRLAGADALGEHLSQHAARQRPVALEAHLAHGERVALLDVEGQHRLLRGPAGAPRAG